MKHKQDCDVKTDDITKIKVYFCTQIYVKDKIMWLKS